VVLTREVGANEPQRAWLPAGAVVSEVPLTRTRFFDDEEVRSELAGCTQVGSFRALVVTSARSALYVGLAREALAPGGRVLSVGVATARAIENEDVEVDVVGEGGALALAPEVDEGPVLLLGAAAMHDELAGGLIARGIEVTTLACYETLPALLSEADMDTLRAADVVFIGAPSAWRVASDFVGARTLVVVPGATTAAAVRTTHANLWEGWSAALSERLAAL
jgi:uroporphyrinogen-III synthase